MSQSEAMSSGDSSPCSPNTAVAVCRMRSERPQELQQGDVPRQHEQRVDQHLRGPALDRRQHAAHHKIHAQITEDGQREQQRRGGQVLRARRSNAICAKSCMSSLMSFRAGAGLA